MIVCLFVDEEAESLIYHLFYDACFYCCAMIAIVSNVALAMVY